MYKKNILFAVLFVFYCNLGWPQFSFLFENEEKKFVEKNTKSPFLTLLILDDYKDKKTNNSTISWNNYINMGVLLDIDILLTDPKTDDILLDSFLKYTKIDFLWFYEKKIGNYILIIGYHDFPMTILENKIAFGNVIDINHLTSPNILLGLLGISFQYNF